MECPDNYEEDKNDWMNEITSAREAGRLLDISHKGTGFKKWDIRDIEDDTSTKIVTKNYYK